jgi:ketosteroid isomerase-like protein
MNEQIAQSFAQEWIAAWNSHDLSRIMSHYSERIQFHSPYIIRLGMNAEGLIDDKPILEAYFKKALDVYQDLHFELHEVLTGAGSLVLYYTSVNGRKAAEFMQLDESGKINLVQAHYNQ